jgi:hypothetical protein
LYHQAKEDQAVSKEESIRTNLILNYVSKTGEWPADADVERMVKLITKAASIVPVTAIVRQ